MAKVKWIILDGVWDHIVSHISGTTTTKEMWDALFGLYQNPFEQRKMFLKEKLMNARMKKSEGIDSFLTRIQDIRDEFAVVGETSPPIEMVRLALNSVTEDWENFV